MYNATVFDIRTSSFFFHFGYKKSLYGIVDLGAALTEIKYKKGVYYRIGLTHDRTVFVHVTISYYTIRKDKKC